MGRAPGTILHVVSTTFFAACGGATISSTVDRATATRYRSATKGRSRALRVLRRILHLVVADRGTYYI